PRGVKPPRYRARVPRLVLSRQFIGALPSYTLCGIGRRHLHQASCKPPKYFFKLDLVRRNRDGLGDRLTCGVIGIRRKSQTNRPLVGFPRLQVELGEPSGFADGKRQYAGGEWVEG